MNYEEFNKKILKRKISSSHQKTSIGYRFRQMEENMLRKMLCFWGKASTDKQCAVETER